MAAALAERTAKNGVCNVSSTRKNGLQKPNGKEKSKVNHDQLWLSAIQPSSENDEIYRPIDLNDPSLRKLAESISQRGVLEPIVVNHEGYILSGHRRYAAAKMAGKRKVPVRKVKAKRGTEKFLTLLREFNRQRVKGVEETLHEEVISSDPCDPRRQLLNHRRQESQIKTPPIDLGQTKRRKGISRAKDEMVEAVLRTFKERADYLPLTVRSVHYALLNYPPLIHASKPNSRYINDKKSYQSLVDLLTRMRVDGIVPMDSIDDETRPVTIWKAFDNPADFIRRQVDDFLKGYYRNLLKSQPHHFELLGEKNTCNVVLERVASLFRMPLTSGRGYASLPPRHKMAERYKASGKDKLVLLVVSDFDPDGDEICRSFGRSMRDDFDIENIHVVKLALTHEQTQEFDLPPALDAKQDSPQYQKFFDRYGRRDTWELESMSPELLEKTVTDGIESAINSRLFSSELLAEQNDQDQLEDTREKVQVMMRNAELLDG